jgi:undecaprenyl diphosphate synthase
MGFKEQIDISRVPQHIAIIMDGNGRWAKNQGQFRVFGHVSGVLSVKDIVEGCLDIGIKYLTIYAFSTENWNRPIDEVNALMELLTSTINNEADRLNRDNVKLNAIGDIQSLPEKCIADLANVMEITSKNTKCTLTLALSYSSRWEITEATRKIAQELLEEKISLADINEETFYAHLNTAKLPDPELLIRTSGERRVSNFLLWQIAYTELYFTETLWPDFRKEDLFEAVVDYQKRERRFGKISEQLN